MSTKDIAKKMQPMTQGRGSGIPRYGGGWMHQWSHVYALQNELLYRPRNGDWFRACEVWHLGRHTGVAMNVEHFSNILKQCILVGQWEQSFKVLTQMRREAIRPDVIGVGAVMAACAEAGKWERCVQVAQFFEGQQKMKLDSNCMYALQVAYAKAGKHREVLQVAERQHDTGMPLLEANLDVCFDSADKIQSNSSTMEADHRLAEQGRIQELEGGYGQDGSGGRSISIEDDADSLIDNREYAYAVLRKIVPEKKLRRLPVPDTKL